MLAFVGVALHLYHRYSINSDFERNFASAEAMYLRRVVKPLLWRSARSGRQLLKKLNPSSDSDTQQSAATAHSLNGRHEALIHSEG